MFVLRNRKNYLRMILKTPPYLKSCSIKNLLQSTEQVDRRKNNCCCCYFVALRPLKTAMVMLGQSVNLTTLFLFPG